MSVKVSVTVPENSELKNQDNRPDGDQVGFSLVVAKEGDSALSIEPKKQASSLWDICCNSTHLGRRMQFTVVDVASMSLFTFL